MIKLSTEDAAKLYDNMAKWLRNKDAAEVYAEYPFLHTKPGISCRHRTFFDYVRQPVDEPQYGVEIELDFEFIDTMVLAELRRLVIAGILQCASGLDLLRMGINVEQDESIPNGMEIVMPPMHVAKLRTVLTSLYKVHGMQFVRNHNECGIHITTDTFPDDASAVAFWNFWQNPRLYDGSMPAIADIIGREPTRHCKIQGEVGNLRQIEQICRVEDRGAVSYRKSGCMEVRVFASVVDAKKVFRQVRLVDAVYRLCVQHKSDVAVLPLIKKRFNKNL